MKKEQIQQLGHLVAGLLTLVGGFEAFEKNDLMTAAGYFAAAIAFLVIAGAHKSLLKKFMQGDMACFLLEALVLLYSGWQYKFAHRDFLYYGLTIAGCAYLLFAILSIHRDPKPKHRSRRGRRRGHRSSSKSIKTEDFLNSTKRPESGGASI